MSGTTSASSAAPVPGRPIEIRHPAFDPVNLLALARKEVRESLRNRWFILYTIAFAALSLALSALSLVGTGSVGFAGFGRTAASLLAALGR